MSRNTEYFYLACKYVQNDVLHPLYKPRLLKFQLINALKVISPSLEPPQSISLAKGTSNIKVIYLFLRQNIRSTSGSAIQAYRIVSNSSIEASIDILT